MPAPSYYVTLTDANGAEFPVRVWGFQLSERDIEGLAFRECAHLAREEPRWNPVAPLTVTAVEPWNQEVE